MPGLLRTLTPWGWGLSLAVVLVLAVVVGRAVGLRWDPFDLAGRRLEAAEHRVETLDRDLAARRLEVEGGQTQARRVAPSSDIDRGRHDDGPHAGKDGTGR